MQRKISLDILWNFRWYLNIFNCPALWKEYSQIYIMSVFYFYPVREKRSKIIKDKANIEIFVVDTYHTNQDG